MTFSPDSIQIRENSNAIPPRIVFRLRVSDTMLPKDVRRDGKMIKVINREAELARINDSQILLYRPSLQKAAEVLQTTEEDLPTSEERQKLLSLQHQTQNRTRRKVENIANVFSKRGIHKPKTARERELTVEPTDQEERHRQAVAHAKRLFERLGRKEIPTIAAELDSRDIPRVLAMLSSLRHDIGSPQTALLGFLQLLSRFPFADRTSAHYDPQKMRGYWHRIGEDLKRFLAAPLTSQTLEAYATHDPSTKKIAMSINPLLAIFEKKITMYFPGDVITEPVPEGVETQIGLLSTSVMAWDNIAKNAATNALKGVKILAEKGLLTEDSHKISVRAGLLSDEKTHLPNFVTIEVSDNGAGVDMGSGMVLPEGQDKSFDGNSNWHGVEKVQGTGNGGLAIQEIVQAEFGKKARAFLRGRKQGATLVLLIPFTYLQTS